MIKGIRTLVVPPLGTQMTKEKKKNHQALMSSIVSINWLRSHFLVCVVRWNFLGRREANSLSDVVRNLAVEGESGSMKNVRTDHAMVMRPKIRKSI